MSPIFVGSVDNLGDNNINAKLDPILVRSTYFWMPNPEIQI